MSTGEQKKKSRAGMAALRRKIMMHGLSVVDKRTLTAKMLVEWRTGIVNDLGGPEAISSQQTTLIELAVRTKLMLEHIDSFILAQDSIIDLERKSLYPVVRERGTLANTSGVFTRAVGIGAKAAARAQSAELFGREGADGGGVG